MTTLRGTPESVDLMLRPFLRIIQLILSLLALALFAFMGWWYTLPIPLLLFEGAVEYILWRRGDTSVTLTLDDHLTLEDPRLGTRLELDPAEVTVATSLFRRTPAGAEVWYVLGSDAEPLFAARVETRGAHRPDAVDLDLMGAIIGGNAGITRALAPTGRHCRQKLDDPGAALQAWLSERVTPAAWDRAGARCWVGLEPAMDLFGLHTERPVGWLVLEGRSFTLTTPAGSRPGDLGTVTGGRATRQAVLLRFTDDLHDAPTGDTELPMLVLDIDEGLVLAFPSTLAGTLGPERELGEGTLHTHLAEGTALAWHLLHHLPADALPENLLAALRDARITVEALPEPLEALVSDPA